MDDRKISLGDFRRLLVEQIRKLLLEAKRVKEIQVGGDFVRRDPTLIIRHDTLKEVVEGISALGQTIKAEFPDLREVVDQSIVLAQAALTEQQGPELVAVHARLMELHRVVDEPASGDNFNLRAAPDAIYFQFRDLGDDTDGTPSSALRNDQADQDFLGATVNMIAGARREKRSYTRDEQAAIAWAYQLLDRGVQMPAAYRGIGVYGLRPHQTNLSLANPGEGHVSVTCAASDLLQGTFVHIEHIDRDGENNREIVEAYRLPAAVNAARVRLHTGSAAPCTAYVGRPLFENGVQLRQGTEIYVAVAFERDLLKTVHLTASAATAMFMNGLADCKIAIERMSVRQAMEFMRAVAGNVVRDPATGRQYLSAAFNINLPIWDDRGDTPHLVTDRYEVAKLAIEVTIAGRFDKVTWDGATNVVPSVPVIEQLTLAQWVELVHLAHEKGLETYVSAGLKPAQIRECTHVGVDGVGIGTSLHYRNPQTNAIGQLNANAVRETLRHRDAAAQEPLGRGARLLAGLDRLFFEGTIPGHLEPARQELYPAMRDRKEQEVSALVEKIGDLSEYIGSEHPVIEQAKRMIKTAGLNPIGARLLGEKVWAQRVQAVNERLLRHDIAGLQETMS